MTVRKADVGESCLSDYDCIAGLPDQQREACLAVLGEPGMTELQAEWRHRARPYQFPPEGDWPVWLVMAGRGFGKTRMGAEWVRGIAERDGSAAIALVGATLHEVRSIMVEGPSGLLAIAPVGQRPLWRPSQRELIWPSGARASLFGAAEPEALRGPQHSHGWADEIGKWPHGVMAWDNLMMGMRLGALPQVMATTTPRPVPLVLRLIDDPAVVTTRGRTWDNRAALPRAFLDEMRRSFGGTRLGRQELEGDLLLDVEGALWTRDLLDRCRHSGALPDFVRVVVAVDPPASAQGDACGIVAAGRDADGIAYVIEDASLRGASPEGWARRVAELAARWQADRVVAEANNGGEMVRAVLQAVSQEERLALPVRLVHASRGKSARAEPVAALYEAGRVRHAGLFAPLEDQLCGLTIDGRYEGPGRSPDRADALVWALTEISLTNGGGARLRRL